MVTILGGINKQNPILEKNPCYLSHSPPIPGKTVNRNSKKILKTFVSPLQIILYFPHLFHGDYTSLAQSL